MNILLSILLSAAPAVLPAPETEAAPASAGGAATAAPAGGPSLPEPTPAQLAWLAANAVPLTTVEAGHGSADLEPLRAMIGSARVVGLGEGTHGTREFFQAKHRLLEFLVTEMGFSIFAIEANMPEAYALNDYVLGGEGDVDALISGMYFWTWRTEEVRDMVEWMRSWNAAQQASGSPARVQFTGFDMQTGRLALRIVSEFLRAHDPAYLASIEDDVQRLAEYSPHGSTSSFGCATGRFPVEDVRGRTVRFSGWIRTEGVDDAWAGLWWRADGPSLRFDNMADRGPRGTTDWQEVSIEMAVPEDATAIYFGLVKPGSGVAWFDALRIEIDGKPWSNPEAQRQFDFDFEGPQPFGIVAADPMRGPPSKRFPGSLDRAIAKTGSSSFRLEPIGEDEGRAAKEAMTLAASIHDHLRGDRDRLIQLVDARKVDWAIQNARVVKQWTELGGDSPGAFAHRDRCMAENIGWILEQNPGARLVVWAHNWHVRDEAPFMGSNLRQVLGPDYVNLAFCASRGEYTAVSINRSGLGAHRLTEPPAGSVEAILEAAGKPIVLVDLRRVASDDPGSSWLAEERLFGGVIGAMEMPEHYMKARLKGPFDLLIYVRDTSAARQLQ